MAKKVDLSKVLNAELTVRDLSVVCRKFPTKNWKNVFILYFQFTKAELQQASFDNQGTHTSLFIAILQIFLTSTSVA